MTSEVEGFYERRRCRVELQEGTVEREDGVDPKVKSLDGLITRILSEVKSLSRVQLFATPWTVAYKAPPSMGFSRQEYWSGLPFPSPGDLPDPGIEPRSPALQKDSLPAEPQVKPRILERVAYPFSSGSSRPRNQTRISCITGGFSTS